MGRKIKNNNDISKNFHLHPNQILDSINNIIVIFDSKGTICYLNKSAYKILGYKKDSLIGKNWFNTCVPKDHLKEVKNISIKCMQGKIKSSKHYESPIISKKGETRVIRWNNKLLKEKNKIIGILSFGEHIMIRKNQEKQIQDLGDFPEENPNPVMRISKDCVIKYSNKAAISISPKAFSVGKNVKNIWNNIILESLQSGLQHELDMKFQDKVFVFTFSPVLKKEYVNIYGHDITSLKESEIEIKERVGELERFNRLAVGRELKMIELKKKIKELEIKQRNKIKNL